MKFRLTFWSSIIYLRWYKNLLGMFDYCFDVKNCKYFEFSNITSQRNIPAKIAA